MSESEKAEKIRILSNALHDAEHLVENLKEAITMIEKGSQAWLVPWIEASCYCGVIACEHSEQLL